LPEIRRSPSTQELPSVLPVFPLPGVLLLPGTQLPLNIFEPRYLNMIDDALRNDRIIGMIQPSQSVTEHLVPENIELCEVGCAGRLTQFSETDDGRYLITLTGRQRFRVLSELEPINGYRRVAPDYGPFMNDIGAMVSGKVRDKAKLIEAMEAYFDARGISADKDAIAAAPDAVLVNTLAMSCPFEPQERQALLECAGVAERADFLLELFLFAAHGGTTPPTDTRQ
jgi:Lon protease-like protein